MNGGDDTRISNFRGEKVEATSHTAECTPDNLGDLHVRDFPHRVKLHSVTPPTAEHIDRDASKESKYEDVEFPEFTSLIEFQDHFFKVVASGGLNSPAHGTYIL